jgi:AraC family transcriptional regulator of adaptative response/methylated-DNA-[protein]-cysteine methyltransferase
MMIDQVRHYIEHNLDRALTLDTLGHAFAVSPFHLQRVFKATTGLTPREYANECRLSAVKKRLSSGQNVTEALYEAGYGSSSRLYERSYRQLGMTPRSYAKHGEGELISCAFVRSSFGLLLTAATERGLCFLQFGSAEDELMDALRAEFKAATIVENAEPLAIWIDSVSKYLSGNNFNLDIPVDVPGTSFQQSV